MKKREGAPLVGVTGIAFASPSSPQRVLVCLGDCIQCLDSSGNGDWTTRLEPHGTILHGVRSCCDDCGAIVCHGSRFLSLLDRGGAVAVPAVNLGDWVLTARFAGCGEVLAVLAHSTLVVLSACDGTVKRRLTLSPALWFCAVICSTRSPLAVAGGMLGGAVAQWREDDANARLDQAGSAVYCLDSRDGRVVCGCDNRALMVLPGGGRAFGHGDRIWDVKWTGSEDGEAVSGGADGTLRWWQPGEAHFCETVFVGRSAVRRLAVCGPWVACGCDDGAVSVWRKPPPPAVRLVLPLPAKVKARFVSVDYETGEVCSVVGNRLFREQRLVLDHSGGAALVFVGHAHGGRLLVAARDGLLMLLDAAGMVAFQRKVCISTVTCALANDAVLVASFDSFVVVDLESGAPLWASGTLPLEPGETLTACALHGRATAAAAGSSRGSLGVCCEGRPPQWLRAAHGDAVTDARLAPDASQLWTLCRDGRVGRWDVETLEARSLGRPRCVAACEGAEAFVGDATTAMVRLHAGGAALFCALPPDEPGTVLGRVPGLLPRSLCAAALWEGRLVAAAVLPKENRIARLEWSCPGEHVRLLRPPSHSCLVNAVVACGDGRVASVGDDGRWALWEQPQRKALFFRKSGGEAVRAAAWWRGRLLLASAAQLSQWRGEVCCARLPLAGTATRVMWLLVVSGDVCLFGDSSGVLHRADLQRWAVAGSARVAPCCLSGACLSGSSAAIITTRGEVLRVSPGELAVERRCRVAVSSLSAIAACGAVDVCAGDDGSVGWMVLPDGRHRAVPLGHTAAVVALLSVRGSVLFSLSNDQTIRAFHIDPVAENVVLLRVLPICVTHPACFALVRSQVSEDAEALIVAGQGIEAVTL